MGNPIVFVKGTRVTLTCGLAYKNMSSLGAGMAGMPEHGRGYLF